MIYFWLDDERKVPREIMENPAYTTIFHFNSVNQMKEMILTIVSMEMIDQFIIDLDHDLGEYAWDGGDGIELMKWLLEEQIYPQVKLHTMNVVGRQNMQAILDSRFWGKEY